MKHKILTSLSILTLALSTGALAQDSDRSKNRLAEKLDLDEAQAAAIQEIYSTKREETLAELEAVLTPEQLEKFNEMRDNKGRDGKRGRKGNDSDSDA